MHKKLGPKRQSSVIVFSFDKIIMNRLRFSNSKRHFRMTRWSRFSKPNVIHKSNRYISLNLNIHNGVTDRYFQRPRHLLLTLYSCRHDCKHRPCPSTICCTEDEWLPSLEAPKWPMRCDLATAIL